MKYYLSLERKKDDEKEGDYKKISLQTINERLEQNDNLQRLCVFLNEFLNEKQLKRFLYQNNLCSIDEMNLDLKIIYTYKKVKALPVLYQSGLQFFDIDNIKKILISKKRDFIFLRKFLNSIDNYYKDFYEYVLFEECIFSFKNYDKIDIIINNLIDRIVLRKGEKINYLMLYRLACTINFLLNGCLSQDEEYSQDIPLKLVKERTLDDDQYYQYSLF